MSEYLTRDEFEERFGAISEATDRLAKLSDRLEQQRTPSKAHLIGAGSPFAGMPGGDSYQPGAFIAAVLDMAGNDPEAYSAAKASLEGMSGRRQDVPAWSKATLGLTDATGGWVIPNAAVDEIVKPAMAKNPYRGLMTVRPGVTAATVDIPFRSAAPARAQVVAWGTTKENVNLVYNGYTATMYTIARIHDMSRGFVRHSAGAAEQDAITELSHAFALGEAYYIREGTGSSEPFGFVPALTNGPATFRTSHTAAAATVAGSVAAAIAKAGAALLGRGRTPEAAVMSASGMSEMLINGADTAGFFLSGVSGPQSIPGLKPGTLVSPWGIPVLIDKDLPTDDLIVAEWSAFKVYTGENYRVDVSETAGSRWDDNLVGFRGEEELGFDARPAVYAGAAQYVTDILS